MDFNGLAASRRCIRGFLPKEVTDGQITALLEAGRNAPSAGNSQPWRFVVVKSADKRAEIYEKACKQPSVRDAAAHIVVCADLERSAARFGDRGRTLYAYQDTAAAIQNILLAAHSLGLGACWCGAFDEPALAGLLGQGEAMRPVALLPIGYPAQTPEPTPRRALEEVTEYI